MISEFIFQRPVAMLMQYEFVLDWQTENTTLPLLAVVAVSRRDGITTIVDISIEGDLPEGFAEVWDPTLAIKRVEFELQEEFAKLLAFETI